MDGDNGSSSTFSDNYDEGCFLVRALHEYRTDNPEHLSFGQLQYIKVNHCDVSGWWHGESDNSCGWFPSNRVERVNHVYETEITSEDYDQIRTGLDGVETQFLGEPVTELVSDSMQMDWRNNSPPTRRTMAGQLAFPPSQLSAQQPYYASGAAATFMDNDPYLHTMSPDIDNVAIFGYSDFAARVALHVRELREATSRREVDRYRQIVIGILSFVRDLLIATNTIARDSQVLQEYPELSVSRQNVLRALGNLYSKCEVADGTRTGMSMRKRRLAVDKLGFFGGRVLAGVTEFTNYAQEIGLSMRRVSPQVQQSEIDISLIASRNEGGASPIPHSRLRRRVSRANSAKGYKSFNAVRQWKAEHLQKYLAAKSAVEQLQAEYMEYLSKEAKVSSMDQIVTTTIQSAQVVKIFLLSADEVRIRPNSKEDQQYVIHRARLSSALIDIFEYVQVVESTVWHEAQPAEIVLNKFMSMASFLFGCLVDLDVHSRSNPTSQEIPLPQCQDYLLQERGLSQVTLTDTISSTETPAEDQRHEWNSPSIADDNTINNSKLPPESSSSSRQTALPQPKYTTGHLGSAASLGRKFVSPDTLSDHYKLHAGGQSSPDKDGVQQVSEPTYDEGTDLERNNLDFSRSGHDSAVVITSEKGTPHHSLLSGYKGPTASIPMVVEEDNSDQSPASNPQSKRHYDVEHTPNDVEKAIQVAERKVTEIFVPAMVQSQLIEETIASTTFNEQTVAKDTESPRLQSIQSSNTLESKLPTASPRSPRSPRADNTTSGSSKSSRNRRVSLTGNKYPSTTETDTNLPEEQNIVGLGVTVPAKENSKNTSSAVSSHESGSIPRPTGSARSRTPLPSPSRPESSRRMPKADSSPNLTSPGQASESKTLTRSGYNSNLSPATMSGSRRASQNSSRSDLFGGRKSHDGQILKEGDFRKEKERRRPSTPFGPRRVSNSGASLRAEALGNYEDVFLGPATPTTPNIPTFVDNQRTSKNQRRESVVSNISVATEGGTLSRSGGISRASSPALRSRNNQQDLSTKGRASIESNISIDRQHHQQSQQGRGGSGPTSYRPRQNRVGQAKGRVSSESRNEAEAPDTDTPWYLENDCESDEVLYNESGVLVAASLDAYIELLTSHKSTPEPSFVTTFFTTFRLFIGPEELVSLLVKRFVKASPEGLGDRDLTAWQQQKQERIQKRVHIALKTWLEGYWVSEKDRSAFRPIMDFVSQEMAETLPGPSSRLLEMLSQWAKKRMSLCLNDQSPTLSKSRSDDRLNLTAQEQSLTNKKSAASISSNKPFATVRERYLADNSKNTGRRGIGGFSIRDSIQTKGPPVPLVNKALLTALANDDTMTKVPVTDIKPVELARQLTIMVGKLFLDIPYLELLAKERPNCSRMIQVSNKITIWVTDTIVDELDIKKRVGIIKHWIEVGEECLKLNNFDTLTAISCAIESTPVKRLYNTWEGISKTYYERSLQLKKMVSSEFNYSVYRAKLKSIRAPCIPFLGLYFTVIAYIEDGNSLYKESNSIPPSSSSSTHSNVAPSTPTPTSARKLLRYGRFEKLAKQVQEFRDFQGVYELLEVPRLREYILKCMENLDSERSYRKSLAIEPRKAPSYIPGANGANGINGASGGGSIGNGGVQRSSAGNSNHRSSGVGRALFYGGLSNSEVNGISSMPAKLNKLSFFRKSTRNDRS
ncbi:hypothetical protein BGZ46_006136 [Entomortierella lignicola]|nr:hypothetical protein BGZ46_006136 [Entomortierella lignicola]